jgi:aminopeptidase N
VHNLHAEPRVWQVPVTVGRIGDAKPRTILVGVEPKQIRFPGCGEPVKANFGDTGYYRTEYTPADFKTLAAAWDRLSEADRLNLLSDSWAMVQAGRAGPGVYLGLTRQLSAETEYAVWAQLIEAFGEIDELEHGSEGREAFRAYARELLKPVLERLGWEPKPDEANAAPLDLLLRNMVIKTLGRFGDKGVIAESQKRFAAFLNAPEKLQPEVRDAVAAVVGYVADRKTFDELHDLARRATGSEAKFRYFFALAGAHDPALIEEVFNIALTDEIPSGRVNRYLAAAARSNDNADRIWQLVAQNRDTILKKLTSGQKQKFLPSIASASANPAIAFELKWKMGDTAGTLGVQYEVDKAVEEIEYKADFKQRLLPGVDEWIKTH